MPSVPLNVPHQQIHVPPIRFPSNIEHVAGKRYAPQESIKDDIPGHAQQHHPGCTEAMRLRYDVGRDGARDEVAEPGDQSDYRIEPEAPVRSGDGEALIEQVREAVQPLIHFLRFLPNLPRRCRTVPPCRHSSLGPCGYCLNCNRSLRMRRQSMEQRAQSAPVSSLQIDMCLRRRLP